jgi:serine/threonine protein kinase
MPPAKEPPRGDTMVTVSEEPPEYESAAPSSGDDPTRDIDGTAPAPAAVPTVDRVGPYKLLQAIGEGGFGTVFLAEQEEPVRRRVAVKIIKAGMDTKQVVARFEAERQALAMMDHPNIAKVLDAGATPTGRPYFVMELVKGVPITEYCDRNVVYTHERLALFEQVCHAVQHAHQKGVIHRDIKPSNVLVAIHDGKPSPKVIDFGIAKATDHRLTEKTIFTEYNQLIGTPHYMSPEQAEMSTLDIDTRTDIYSLGVLLYELLTGTTPFDPARLREAGYGEIQRIIREEEPPRPSTRLSTLGEMATDIARHRHTEPTALRKALRGELDWIVMKAMEKDRTRRYETANALALDIVRHLGDEPVLARPASAAYRFRKFARRHRAALATGGVVVVALGAGLFLATYGLLQARTERDNARISQHESEAVTDFLTNMLHEADPGQAGRDVTVMQVLEKAAGADALDAEPLIEARIRVTIGIVYRELSEFALAETQLREAVSLYDRELGPDAPRRLRAAYQLAVNLWRQSRLDEADEVLHEVYERQRIVEGPNHPDTLDTQNLLGLLYWKQGDEERAFEVARDNLAARRIALGDRDPDTLDAMNNLANRYHTRGRLDEAEPLYRDAIRISSEVHGPEHTNTLLLMNNFADLLRRQEKLDEAEAMLDKVLALRKVKLGPHHAKTLATQNMLAKVYTDQERFDEADALFVDTIAQAKEHLEPGHYRTLGFMSNYAKMLVRADRRADAVEVYTEAAALATREHDRAQLLEALAELEP